MIEVKEALTKKQQREFLNFPLELYKNNKCFVPPLYVDEKKIFRKDYVYYDTCEAVYYNAYKDGKIVGRISGILQKASNEKWNQNRIRFTRFDCIEDFEVAKALFDTVEKWGISKGTEEICGPLGFSDLEREGLLIEGFDQMSTFEEQYNAPYYKEFIERLGYVKEADWNESQLRAPQEGMDELKRAADIVMERYNLRIGAARNINDFIKKYVDGFFVLLDKSYDKIYGTVPFTDGMKKLMISNFKLLVNLKYVAVILDENDNVVCFGLILPAIGKALQKSRGHLTPCALVKVLKAIRKPEVIDLALIGVEEEYLKKGVASVFAYKLMERLATSKTIKYADTNLNLEDNYPIQNLWKRFDRTINKRRRSYLKKLSA